MLVDDVLASAGDMPRGIAVFRGGISSISFGSWRLVRLRQLSISAQTVGKKETSFKHVLLPRYMSTRDKQSTLQLLTIMKIVVVNVFSSYAVTACF